MVRRSEGEPVQPAAETADRTSTIPVPKVLLPYLLAALIGAGVAGGGSVLAQPEEADHGADRIERLAATVHSLELSTTERLTAIETRLNEMGACGAGGAQ